MSGIEGGESEKGENHGAKSAQVERSNVFMSESRKFVDKLCAVDIRKITWYQNVFGRIHRHCSNRRRIHG